MGTTKLLVICEFPLISLGIQEYLKPSVESIEIVAVSTNQEQAIEAMQRLKPDVVLIDTDGTIKLKTISELCKLYSYSCLVLTDNTNVENIDDAIRGGVSGIFGKKDPLANLPKAIDCIQQGELWLDRTMTRNVLRSMAKSDSSSSASPDMVKLEKLTKKERKVVAEIGLNPSASNITISDRLHISDNTLRNHLTSIYAKLELRNRVELYAFANRNEIKA